MPYFFFGPFYTRLRVFRLDEFGQPFLVRLVMLLYYRDGHKKRYRLDERSFVVR